MMENLIYWKGVAVGIDCGSYVSWFPSAPMEAIKYLKADNGQKWPSDFIRLA